MSAAAALWANDLRNVLRDRTVSVLLFVPLILAAGLRFGLPAAEQQLPLLVGYRPLVLALFCLLAGSFPAFMTAFIMLDEKDEDLFSVFRVMPIAPRRFLLLRLTLVVALAFVYPLIILVGSGLAPYPPAVLAVLAALCAVMAPSLTLIVVSVATNKIEGLTLIKALFPFVLLPAAGVLVHGVWKLAFVILPAYWIYRAFAAAPDAAALAAASAGALITHGLLAVVFYRRFRRRVFP